MRNIIKKGFIVFIVFVNIFCSYLWGQEEQEEQEVTRQENRQENREETDREKEAREEAELKKYSGRRVIEVEVTENRYSREDRVLNILGIKENSIFWYEDFKEGIQDLWNLGRFYRVEYEVIPYDPTDLAIEVSVWDKWAILPIFYYISGGGTTRIRGGLYASNIDGRFKEVGGAYEYLNGNHLGKLWLIDPNVLGTPLFLRLDLFFDGSVNIFYDSKESSPNRLLQLLHLKRGASLELAQPLVSDLIKLLFSYRVYSETIQSEFVANNIPEIYSNFQIKKLFIMMFTLGFKIGKVNLLEDYYHQGAEFTLTYDIVDKALGSSESFFVLKASGKLFTVLFKDWVIGQKISFWKSYSKVFYRQESMGGLEHLRGFLGTHFHGDNLYFYNFELRVPIFNGKFIVIPDVVVAVVPFFDVGYIWDGEFFSKKMFQDYAMDAGLGFRFKIRRILDAQFRLDIGWNIHPGKSKLYISTSLLHFF